MTSELENRVKNQLEVCKDMRLANDRSFQKLGQINELAQEQHTELKKNMAKMLEDKKEIEDILKYFKENYRDIEQPQNNGNQNPEESKNQQIQFQNTTLANSLNNQGSMLVEQQNYSGVVKLTFIFKNRDENFTKTQRNSNIFNGQFVKSICNHIREKIRLNTLQTKQMEQQILRFQFKALKKYSGGGDKEALLPDVFEYDLLPSYIMAKWEPNNLYQVLSPNATYSCEIIQNSQSFQNAAVNSEDQDRIKQRQFENFCKYFQKKGNEKIQSFSVDQLRMAVQKTKDHFFAIDNLLDVLGQQLQQFTSEVFSSPKGILFFGPPGTGKSAISLKMCELLEVKLVAPPMAAGDFSKGIVGDSERMLNEIAERAQLIPWETCFLLVDEIDSMVPDRTSDSGKNKDSGLLGVFLAILDGAKQTPNLKIFASTNLRENIDSAFLRRMEIQLFLGNPSAQARLEWIKKKSLEAVWQLDNLIAVNQNNKHLVSYKKDLEAFVNNDDKKNVLQQITLNFSADALRKVLERFYHQIMIGNYAKGIMDLMSQQVKFTANEMKIRIGKDLVVDIIEQIPERQNFITKYDKYFKFIQKDGEDVKKDQSLYRIISPDSFRSEDGERLRISRRMIIDLCADLEESLQIETQRILPERKNSYTIKQLQAFKKIASSGRNNDIENYRYLAKCFPQFLHIDQNKGRMKTLNSYRIQFHKNPKFSPSGNEFDLIKDYNHLVDSFIQQLNNPPRENQCTKLADNSEELNQSWLQFIIVLSTSYIMADCVKLIDANFLYQNNVSDDSGASKIIIDTVNQMKEYQKSVVIFDIDSIAGITKQYSSMKKDISQATNSAIEDNEGASFSYQKIRSNAMDVALKFGQNLLHSDGMWIFYISRSKMMTLEIKNALNFPKTPQEQEFDDTQSEQDIQRRCGRCLSYYTDRENEEDKCGRHTLQLYNVQEFMEKKDQQNLNKEVAKKSNLDFQIKNDTQLQRSCDKFSKSEVLNKLIGGEPINDFKYLCCQKTVFEKGEILCSHQEIGSDNVAKVEVLSQNNYDLL